MSGTPQVQTPRDKRKARQSAACSSFVWYRGDFSQRIRPVGPKQSIAYTTVKFHGECVKMCQDLAPKFRDKRTASCINTTRRLVLPFSLGIFNENNATVVPSHPTSLHFPYRTWNWEADILTQFQAVWTPSQNRISRMHLRVKWQKRWERQGTT
jgi:hypothetical protein